MELWDPLKWPKWVTGVITPIIKWSYNLAYNLWRGSTSVSSSTKHSIPMCPTSEPLGVRYQTSSLCCSQTSRATGTEEVWLDHPNMYRKKNTKPQEIFAWMSRVTGPECSTFCDPDRSTKTAWILVLSSCGQLKSIEMSHFHKSTEMSERLGN